ncbi:hypothetical protein [Methylobacterium sp. D48H]
MRSRLLARIVAASAALLIAGPAFAYDASKAPRYASPDMYRPNVDQLTVNGAGGIVCTNPSGCDVSGLSVTMPGAASSLLPNVIAGRIARQPTNLTVSVPGTAATPQAGVDLCSILAIDRTATCTVQIAGGASTSSQITVRSPYGDRIVIAGATPSTTPVSAVSAVTGANQAYSVTLTVGSTSGITVGAYVQITGMSGVPMAQVHSGVWKVTAVSGSSVTVTNTASNGAPPTGAITGTLTAYPTQLKFTGTSGIVAASLGGVSNLVLIGDGTTPGTFGLWAKSPDATQPGAVMAGPIAVTGFVDNVRANYGGVIHGTQIVSSSAMNNGGISRDGAYLGCFGCAFTGNGMSPPPGGGNGVLIENGSTAFFTGPLAWGNAGAGMFSRTVSSLLVDSGSPGSAGRNLNGWQSSYSAFLQALGSDGSYNASAGWRAEGNASMFAGSTTATSNLVNGYWALDSAFMSAASSTSSNNTFNGYSGQTRARIDASGSTATGNGSSTYVAGDWAQISTPAGMLNGQPAGAVMQSAAATPYLANADLTAAIALTDSVPACTAGTQVSSVTITPSLATSRVRLRWHGQGSRSAAGAFVATICRSGTANALRAGFVQTAGANQSADLVLELDDAPGTTAAVTYTVNVGPDSGTLRLNGSTTGRYFGGASAATLIAEELR